MTSFYTMYKRGPVGEYHVGVCTNSLCAVMGGDAIFADLLEHLGVGNDETTPDGKVSLEHLECNAACDYAPVVMVNWEFFDNMTPQSARDLVDGLRAGAEVTPTRGAPRLCTWKQASRILAGLPRRPGRRRPHRRRAQPGRPAQGQGAGLDARDAAGSATQQRRSRGDAPSSPRRSPRYWDEPDSFTLAGYRRDGGYQALPKALAMAPDEVIQTVKESVLRGRGGAGFPTGVKWGFIPQGDGKPHYLVVNADESEPGACKDIPTMLANPQALIEGIVIACYAIRANTAFIYVRGEVLHVIRRLQYAVARGPRGRLPGQQHPRLRLRPGHHRARRGGRLHLRRGDGAAGLAGGIPRPAPAEAAVPGDRRACTPARRWSTTWSRSPACPGSSRTAPATSPSLGTEKSKGFGIFSLSGHVTTPGQYEAPLGTTLRELLGLAGGIRAGHRLKFWTPGGSSTPLFTDEQLDVPLDYESVAAAGSMLGTRSIQLFDETTCVVRVVLRWTEFYEHESCGKCTPCREGSYWVVQLLERPGARRGQRGRPGQAAGHLQQHHRPGVLRPRRLDRASVKSSIKLLPRRVPRASAQWRLPVRPRGLHPVHLGVRPMTVQASQGAGGGRSPARPTA